MVSITDSAQEYLKELLTKQDSDGIAVRIFILDAGTPRAATLTRAWFGLTLEANGSPQSMTLVTTKRYSRSLRLPNRNRFGNALNPASVKTGSGYAFWGETRGNEHYRASSQ